MKKLLIILFAIFSCHSSVYAQTSRYLVKIKDKQNNNFSISNPQLFLSKKALDRRTKYGIAIDSTDLPVSEVYIDAIRNTGNVQILNRSKWLNIVSIKTTDSAALSEINKLSFVESTLGVARRIAAKTIEEKFELEEKFEAISEAENEQYKISESNYFNYGKSNGQVHLHQGEFLHNHGFRGEGVNLAVLDAGFLNYKTLPTFDSIRNRGQIKDIWDFVSREESINEDNFHGMACLSTIAANLPGKFVGTAPNANFFLYRTEDAFSETKIEELNLAAGFERADSIGADLCTVSLGYYEFDDPSQNYTYASMDGITAISSKAAKQAVKKGLLCLIAAGNEGTSRWHFIIAPSDVDGVIAVGAVDTLSRTASFTSYGPSADGRVKPNLAATGLRAIVANSSTGDPVSGNGTSYATPNLAGLTVCLFQAFPEYSNLTIIGEMEKSGSNYNNPNVRIGYGIPDMKNAFVRLLQKTYTGEVDKSGCMANFKINVKQDSSMAIVVERKLLTDTSYTLIKTITGTDSFSKKTMNFSDNLSGIFPDSIKYRFRMDIASDTSFYLDSVSINHIAKPNLGSDKSIIKCSSSFTELSDFYISSSYLTKWTYGGKEVASTLVADHGEYMLEVTNAEGCTDTAFVNVENNFGICKKEGLYINKFPVRGNLELTLSRKKVENVELVLYDSYGHIIEKLATKSIVGEKSISMPLSQISAGVYHLSLFASGKKVQTISFVKNND